MTASKELFAKAQELIPGGVNSPVRACRSVNLDPLFIKKASGSRLYTEDGAEMIDYVMSWGPMLLGHNDPAVNAAIHAAVDNGTSFGAPCRAEIDLAEAVIKALPGMDMVRMASGLWCSHCPIPGSRKEPNARLSAAASRMEGSFSARSSHRKEPHRAAE